MNIGIITWFSGENYGTNLQAIALQRYLRNIGYSVQIINFQIDAEKKDNRTFWQKVKSQPQKYATKCALKKYGNQIEQRFRKMQKEIQENCIFTARVSNERDYIDTCNQFDILICGSDQIWNPNWYHRFYYADYSEINSIRISYAPSVGVNMIRDEQTLEIKRSLSRFSAVSVREYKGASLLKPLSPKEPVVVVDPTLLLDINNWDAMFPVKRLCKEKYLLSVFLTDNRLHWRAAKKFAMSKKLKHVIIPYCGFSYFLNAEIHADAGIQDFLNLIRGAEYILTDSFHVTVFSLIFRKQFYTFERFKENDFSSQNERVRNILQEANAMDRLVPYGTRCIQEKNNLEYSKVKRVLNNEIDKSKAFLIRAIDGSTRLENLEQ